MISRSVCRSALTALRSPVPSTASASFSTSALRAAFVSHIGREPIKFPENVTLTQSPTELTVTGPLGSTAVPLREYMSLEWPEKGIMTITVADSSVKVQRAMWGTTRTHIANAITGMTEGFSVPLYLVGVGYRVAMEEDPRGTSVGGSGKRLAMKVGNSHTTYVPVPPHIKAEVPNPTKITLFCTDKHLLGLFAAQVRSHRRPEPYKGKGIFIGNEQIRIRAVKKK